MLLLIIPLSLGIDPFVSVMIIQFSLNVVNFLILLKIFQLIFKDNVLIKINFCVFYFFFQFYIIYQFQFRQESLPITIMIIIAYLLVSFEIKIRSQGNAKKEKIYLTVTIILAYFMISLHYLGAFFCFLFLLSYFIVYPKNFRSIKILVLLIYPICILLYWMLFFKYYGLIDLTLKTTKFLGIFFSNPVNVLLFSIVAVFIGILLVFLKKRHFSFTNNKFTKSTIKFIERFKIFTNKRLLFVISMFFIGLFAFIILYYVVFYDMDYTGVITNAIQNVDIPVYIILFSLVFIYIFHETSTESRIYKTCLIFSLFVMVLFSGFYVINLIGVTPWQFRFLYALFLPAFIIAPKGIAIILASKKKKTFIVVAIFLTSAIIGGFFFLKKGIVDDPFNDYMTREEYNAGIWMNENLPRNSCLILNPKSRAFIYAASSYPYYPPGSEILSLYDTEIFMQLFGISLYNTLKDNPDAEQTFINVIKYRATRWNTEYGRTYFYLVINEADKQDPHYMVNYWMFVFENTTYFEKIYEENPVAVIKIDVDMWF